MRDFLCVERKRRREGEGERWTLLFVERDVGFLMCRGREKERGGLCSLREKERGGLCSLRKET
jgi:hypothetical protein